MNPEKAQKGNSDWELKIFKILILLIFVYLILPIFGINYFAISPIVKRSDFNVEYPYEYFQIGLTQAKTEGDWTYIPINIKGRPGDYYSSVIYLIRQFEKEKNVKVINRWFEKNESPFAPSFVGIWLNHEPKK